MKTKECIAEQKLEKKKVFEFKPFYTWDYLELLGFVNYLQESHPRLTRILIEDFEEKITK